MAPLLVSALVGIGVKIVTDLFFSGAKQVMKSGGTPASFATALDKAREAAPASPAGAPATKAAAVDLGFGDRSRVLTAEAANALPGAARAYGVASYQRLDDIPPQAI